MHNMIITAECVADLPTQIYKENSIDIIYYDIKTEMGVFRDTDEIDSQNVMEYMSDGKKTAISIYPSANAYKNFFSKKLREYDEVIHVCISSSVSGAYDNAVLAKVKMGRDGERIHIIDSRHLSSGQGLLVMKGAEYLKQGLSSEKIVEKLEALVPLVSSSFLSDNANYLYFNGKVKKGVMEICNFFHIHPVLAMVKGKLVLSSVCIGNYNGASKRYIKRTLRNAKNIQPDVGFITYAGCSSEILSMVRERTLEKVPFETLYEQQASATISSNCGPKTFGILFINKE